MQLNIKFPFADTLAQVQQENKGVTLHMRSGEKIQGRIEAVSPQQVIIAEITGREFYSAVVRLEDVSALEVRTRDH